MGLYKTKLCAGELKNFYPDCKLSHQGLHTSVTQVCIPWQHIMIMYVTQVSDFDGGILSQCFFLFLTEKDGKTCFSTEKFILTSKRCANHPFAGRNTQHTGT